jgi:hypothetical protein
MMGAERRRTRMTAKESSLEEAESRKGQEGVKDARSNPPQMKTRSNWFASPSNNNDHQQLWSLVVLLAKVLVDLLTNLLDIQSNMTVS